MGLLDKVTKSAPNLPSRVYHYAQEKWGKTSWATEAPDPIFIMTEGETGLLSLIETGLVKQTAHFPEDAKSWPNFLECVMAVLREDHAYKTLVIDTSNGAERLLQRFVLETEFNNVMNGKYGYSNYGKGDLSCVGHWQKFLTLLDQIRMAKKMSIILLAHARTRTVNNPEGDDYDQIRPEGIDKLWSLTHKWADVISCGTFNLTVKDDKVKATSQRIIRTGGTSAVICGNRYGLPELIQCGSNHKDAWGNFARAIQTAKQRGKQTGEGNGDGGSKTPAPQHPQGNGGGGAAASPGQQASQGQTTPQGNNQQPQDARPFGPELGDAPEMKAAQGRFDFERARNSVKDASDKIGKYPRALKILLESLGDYEVAFEDVREEFGNEMNWSSEECQKKKLSDLTMQEAELLTNFARLIYEERKNLQPA